MSFQVWLCYNVKKSNCFLGILHISAHLRSCLFAPTKIKKSKCRRWHFVWTDGRLGALSVREKKNRSKQINRSCALVPQNFFGCPISDIHLNIASHFLYPDCEQSMLRKSKLRWSTTKGRFLDMSILYPGSTADCLAFEGLAV